MNNIEKLYAKLHPLERKVLIVLPRIKTFNELVEESKLSEIEVMRAIQWLANKKVITIKEDIKEFAELDQNGMIYIKHGLPEKRFLKVIKGTMRVDNIRKEAKLDINEINICIGLLRRKAAIEINNDKGLSIKILPQGINLIKKDSLEETFLKSLARPREISTFSPEDMHSYNELKKRKGILKTTIRKLRFVNLTPLGKELSNLKVDQEGIIDSLTLNMLRDKSWEKKRFRAYDVEINVPNIYGGKRHFVKQSIEYAKRVWMDMGFKEMEGPMLNTSFWNFDALYTAQDHPVRDLQDTFYIKEPKNGKVPEKNLMEEVKKAHEKGTRGSTGWGYKWSIDDAKKNVLRTHTTVLSAKTIATLKKTDLPAKFFAVGRCFRNEAVDWCHLFEFNQTEGIVIDPNANFRHLLGYLKEFFKKMGYPKARFRPAHFPYTEPSLEIDVFHPVHKKWVELGGAGIFRPEVVEPLLGEAIPVLAWGPGFDRIMMEFYNLTDLRDLYRNDLKQLRNLKVWLK